MNNQSFEPLEIEHLRKSLSDYLYYSVNTEEKKILYFLHDFEEWTSYTEKVKQIHRYLSFTPGLNFTRVNLNPDIFTKIKVQGYCLEDFELADFRSLFQNYFMILTRKESVDEEKDFPPVFSSLISVENLNHSFMKEMLKIVDAEGRLIESRIPALMSLKKSIEKLESETQKLADSYLQRNEWDSYFQDKFISSREGRVVLPIKSNFKGKIKGIIHEVSNSGNTIFLEPLDLVDKNNELREKRDEYKKEYHKVMMELSSKISMEYPVYEKLFNNMSELDMYHGKAALGFHNEYTFAEYDKDNVKLIRARHPDLGNKCVPVTILLENPKKVLIISGPNTGGKTVALKTLGLTAIMNQMGMAVPCAEGTVLPLFHSVFADIGDHQSIEESLSTFSGHMKTISQIINESDNESLILLDELGSGTDPQEGWALAESMINFFIKKSSWLCVTTHHGKLKELAYKSNTVQNAMVNFDKKSYQPLYEIINGIAGESHGLKIAGIQGIDPEILKEAQNILDENKDETSAIIENIHKIKREIDEREHKIREAEKKLIHQTEKIEQEKEQLEIRKKVLKEDALKDVNSFYEKNRRDMENLVRKIQEQANEKLNKETTKEVKDFLKRSGDEVAALSSQIERNPDQEKAKDFSIGQTVLLKNLGQSGEIVKKGKKNRWIIKTKNLNIEIDPADLEAMEKKNSFDKKDIQVISTEAESAKTVLDVRGMRAEEALEELSTQIDRALLTGLHEFSVIHGMGEGILQERIHEFLGIIPSVRTFHFARPEDGGFGKTYIFLE